MSSLHEHLDQHTASDPRKTARDALLTAITEQVEDAKGDARGEDVIDARLKKLAEAYALVVHGKP